MFLKRIYISGFKSFCDPLELDLREGMTAIVGPNGCGKTNISDAVRWALGEQSARNLRGGQMSDVIFSGSEERKPLGMAEVSLLLSNESHLLDAPFEEVLITRRLFRSGESAYLLNKKPCRLKDITGLLTDTGIGTRAYSLIEQAQVDQILSRDPRQRRGVFDEAAGIGRYKAQRAEAERKLGETVDQLLRLDERLDEIAKHLRSLKREVRKVEHHRRLGEQIHRFRALTLRFHWEGRRGRLEELDGELAELDDAILGAEADFTRLEGELTELRTRQIEARERVNAAEDRRYRSLEEVKDYEHRLSLNQDRRTQRRRRARELQREREELTEQRAALEERHATAEESLADRRREHQTAEERLAHLEAELSGLRGEFEEAERRSVELGARLMRAVESAAGRERDLAEARARRRELERELQRLDAELAALEEETAELAQTDAVDEAAKLEGRLEKLQERLDEALERQNERNREISRAATETRSKLEELTRAQTQFASLERLYDRNEGFKRAVTVVLAAADKQKLGGILGAVAQLVRTDKRYEAAVEAALGFTAQAVVCADENAAAAAIELLKRLRAGRVRFLPLDLIRPRRPIYCAEQIQQPGLIGDVLGLVDFADEVAPAIEFALGGTLVLEDMASATALLRAWRDRVRFRRLVTLDGELVESSGAISGGGARSGSGGLLGRERELEQLRDNLATLKQQYEAARARENELRDEFSASSSALEQLREQVSQTRLELERTRETADNRRRETKRLDERRQETAAARRRADLELEALDAEPAPETDDGAEQRELRAAHDVALKERDRSSARLDALRETVAEEKLGLQRLDSDLDSVADELQRVEAALSDNERRRRDVETAEREIEEEDAAADQDLEELNSRLAELTLGKESDEQHLIELRRALNELGEELGGLTESRAAANARLGELRQRRSALELEKKGVADESNRLEDEAREHTGHELLELELPDAFDLSAAHTEIGKLEKRRNRLGEINFHARKSYEESLTRRDYLRERRDELRESDRRLRTSIKKLNAEATERFLATFNQVVVNFENTFRFLFGGGEARLKLTDDDPLEAGVEIYARPPGKGLQQLISRSGGERALTAIALLFALFEVKPSPFSILDEIDAPLDDANVDRFLRLLRRHLGGSQFLVITHNRRTMEAADTLIGVTMDEPGVSRIYGLAFSQGQLVTEEDQRRFSLRRKNE